MIESRKQFEEWAEEIGALPWGYLRKQRTVSGSYYVQIYNYMWSAWQASRQSQSVAAYLTHQGSAVSPDDFEGGEAEMHETAKREEWVPLMKGGE